MIQTNQTRSHLAPPLNLSLGKVFFLLQPEASIAVETERKKNGSSVVLATNISVILVVYL